MIYKWDSKTRKELKRREEELNKLRREGNLTDQKILEPFDGRFPNEHACLNYLLDVRWGENRKRFRCPHEDRGCVKCGGRDFNESPEGRFRCTKCHAFISVKAGTLFQDSKLSLRQWFMGMWFMAYRKWGLNALELQRLLGINSYRIALAFLHKMRSAMSDENRKPLRGKVVKVIRVRIELSSSEAWVLVVHQDPYIISIKKRSRKDPYEPQFPSFVRLRHLSSKDTPLLPFLREWVQQEYEIVVWTEEEFADEPWSRSQNYNHRVTAPASDQYQSCFDGAQLAVDRLRKWLSENFRSHVKPSYLQNYLDEFAFWYNRQFIWSDHYHMLVGTYRWIAFDQLLESAIQTEPSTK